jgi:hypothetical protein
MAVAKQDKSKEGQSTEVSSILFSEISEDLLMLMFDSC